MSCSMYCPCGRCEDMTDVILAMESEDSLATTYVPCDTTPKRVVTEVTTINRRRVEPDRLLRIRGQRGKFKFIKRVSTPHGGNYIDVWGPVGRGRKAMFRSFDVSEVRTVHNVRA